MHGQQWFENHSPEDYSSAFNRLQRDRQIAEDLMDWFLYKNIGPMLESIRGMASEGIPVGPTLAFVFRDLSSAVLGPHLSPEIAEQVHCVAMRTLTRMSYAVARYFVGRGLCAKTANDSPLQNAGDHLGIGPQDPVVGAALYLNLRGQVWIYQQFRALHPPPHPDGEEPVLLGFTQENGVAEHLPETVVNMPKTNGLTMLV